MNPASELQLGIANRIIEWSQIVFALRGRSHLEWTIGKEGRKGVREGMLSALYLYRYSRLDAGKTYQGKSRGVTDTRRLSDWRQEGPTRVRGR